MNAPTLVDHSRPFLTYLADWHDRLTVFDLAEHIKTPAQAAVISVDLIRGFCTLGPLASPRVQAIVAPAARLFERAYALGVRHFVLAQDTHEPDAVEFGSFPPHCVRGTEESETVPELAVLPFASQFTIVPKNSLNPERMTTGKVASFLGICAKKSIKEVSDMSARLKSFP